MPFWWRRRRALTEPQRRVQMDTLMAEAIAQVKAGK
jgi:hypothetical protein